MWRIALCQVGKQRTRGLIPVGGTGGEGSVGKSAQEKGGKEARAGSEGGYGSTYQFAR